MRRPHRKCQLGRRYVLELDADSFGTEAGREISQDHIKPLAKSYQALDDLHRSRDKFRFESINEAFHRFRDNIHIRLVRKSEQHYRERLSVHECDQLRTWADLA